MSIEYFLVDFVLLVVLDDGKVWCTISDLSKFFIEVTVLLKVCLQIVNVVAFSFGRFRRYLG